MICIDEQFLATAHTAGRRFRNGGMREGGEGRQGMGIQDHDVGWVFRQTGCWPAQWVPEHHGGAPVAPEGAAWQHLPPGCPSPPPQPRHLLRSHRRTGETPWGPAVLGPLLSPCPVASPWWSLGHAAHGFASTCEDGEEFLKTQCKQRMTPNIRHCLSCTMQKKRSYSVQPTGIRLLCVVSCVITYFASHSATALLSTDWAFPRPSFGSSLFRREKGWLGQWRLACVNRLPHPTEKTEVPMNPVSLKTPILCG